ncbi:CCA tRNA nucleotidyltransferase [Hyphococcus sp.]|uniref:CCA tRNA nucleotidyltransferase n=1 Tax=Hyphococcus sp. TaxID=2038636 RepID=UPI003CCC383A
MSAVSTLLPLPESARANFDWLNNASLKRVIGALETAEAGAARFVGGCVRDSLLGVVPKDFDIATLLEPDAAISALKQQGLRVAPTGLAHGTVTAIVDHQGVEITTLRADVSTDGRRATVAFTRNWETDAQRRDFTINAIYLTPDGKLFDPVGGVRDAGEKRVRFIGDASQRIKEDYLRILRFFRFTARFCETFDEEGLAACAALKDGLDTLSAERVGAETMAILALPRAAIALSAMQTSGVLGKIWPAQADLNVAAKMKMLDPSLTGPVMLAGLYGEAGDGIGRRLRLSNAEKAVRATALKSASRLILPLTESTLREQLYRFGKNAVTDGVLLAAARGRINEPDYKKLRRLLDKIETPVFEISGKHIVNAGVSPGPAVADILATVEARWIDENFPDVARQKTILADVLKSTGKQPS